MSSLRTALALGARKQKLLDAIDRFEEAGLWKEASAAKTELEEIEDDLDRNRFLCHFGLNRSAEWTH